MMQNVVSQAIDRLREVCQHITMIRIHPVPAIRDNYIWLLIFGDRRTVIVDPGDAKPVMTVIREHGLYPIAILITHNHWDHVDGIGPLLDQFAIPVYGPANEPVPHLTQAVGEGQRVTCGTLTLHVMDVPGHTPGHVAYALENALLVGDTLFGGGCGRLRGGSAAQLYESLQKINGFPKETEIYCTHEYTLDNLRFAQAIETGNTDIKSRIAHADEMRKQGRPTLPTTLELERRTNPFLRCHEPAVIAAAEAFAQRPLATGTDVFTVLRKMKDGFA